MKISQPVRSILEDLVELVGEYAYLVDEQSKGENTDFHKLNKKFQKVLDKLDKYGIVLSNK